MSRGRVLTVVWLAVLVLLGTGGSARAQIARSGESLGPRDRIRFFTKLMLSRETKLPQIEAVVSKVREKLRAHPSVLKDDVFVRLSTLGEWSFDVEVTAPIQTTDAPARQLIGPRPD